MTATYRIPRTKTEILQATKSDPKVHATAKRITPLDLKFIQWLLAEVNAGRLTKEQTLDPEFIMQVQSATTGPVCSASTRTSKRAGSIES
jgi:hypothetical protein